MYPVLVQGKDRLDSEYFLPPAASRPDRQKKKSKRVGERAGGFDGGNTSMRRRYAARCWTLLGQALSGDAANATLTTKAALLLPAAGEVAGVMQNDDCHSN
ncbi:unnamed protein product [Soboliphyme baturini]|uniref:Uncharacterized protein n=1 Tax=Soboliphyme baturini TaxID=241478 RepID=A0A183ISE2_9BILA|nr:unnamed protein product [Soboliphyme baturini]